MSYGVLEPSFLTKWDSINDGTPPLSMPLGTTTNLWLGRIDQNREAPIFCRQNSGTARENLDGSYTDGDDSRERPALNYMRNKMTRHKHADVIHAWAEGAEIQKFCGDGWYNDSDTPEWFEDCEYRIKPRTVKHEGWVNIYRLPGGEFPSTVCCVHPTEETAKTVAGIGTVARVKVEWEESL